MSDFAVGQRWASEMEPELGIGIIDAVEGRTVHLRYPDSGMVRLYAAQSAPLRRVVFHPGDRVQDDAGNVLTITTVEMEGDLMVYCSGDTRLREDRLAGLLTLDTPKDRILAGQRDASSLFDLRRRILGYRHRMTGDLVEGFVGGRVDLIAHQFAIAHEVSDRTHPRVLLADETGLGKTIEAGLIIHRLIMTGRISRILIIVPDALVVQWYVELARRFNLRFRFFDDTWLASLDTAAGHNPFEQEPLGLCSVSFITQAKPALNKHLLEGQYDLLVVDEAHHMQPDGRLFALVEALSQVIWRVILITATPGHLSSHGHYARLKLLDPQRYPDYDRFKAENQSFEQIARLVEALVKDPAMDSATLGQLADSAGITDRDIRQVPTDLAGRQQLIKRIIDRYGTGRVMFKTTRQMVSGFPGRQARMLPLDIKADGRGIRDRIDREVLADCALEAASSEIDFADDPRVAWLEGYLQAHRNEKILLICHSAEKVKALHAQLERRISVKTGRYHDGMTLVQRDRNAAWFAQPDGAVLLLCSEIGSEGRNFQFARHLVLFDLPPDPELLEQRIGRLDRIGQKGVVKVMVPFVRGTAGEILARWYHEALSALEQNVPAAGWVMRRLWRPLCDLIRDPRGAPTDVRLDRLIRCGRFAIARQQRFLESGRDRLLELGILAAPIVDRLIEGIQHVDADPVFPELVEQLLDAWGIVMDPIDRGVYHLVPDHRYADALPGFRPSGLTITTDRQLALTREDLDFLTADHPLVTGAMDHFLGTGKGNAAFACLPSASQKTILLEMLFVIEAAAPANTAPRTFLPPTLLRVVVDHELGEQPKWLSEADAGALADGPDTLWTKILPLVSPVIPQMVEKGRRLAQKRSKPIIATARQAARQTLGETVSRLEALGRANPAIADQDIVDAKRTRDAVLAAVDKARVRLDALRLVVTGEIG
ncbi:RapA: RNA polymerase-associated protein A [Desulfosarcina variabilis str. Montpellier]|uniref:RNA polymerase-associated protein RapA n=1 Tax=Desulfosarcina variabilis TaxID=2300 RepID=UPI003AFB25B8